jgi:predicted MFS family arabinose efflux permease
VLASHLTQLGFTPIAVGALVTAALLGSAALTLVVGLYGARFSRRRLLIAASLLMAATGAGFAGLTTYWPLMLVAFVGTLNPTAGDVSLFLPTEQAILSGTVSASDRTLLFAYYNLSGTLAGALGALVSGLPFWLAQHHGWPLDTAHKAMFVGYAGIALGAGLIYRRLSSNVELPAASTINRPLATSRSIVLRLAILFSLDSLGGGFVVQSLLALWLFRRFGLSVEAAATAFFAMGVLAAGSQIVSARLAGRIGLVNTMVFTHLPANIFLILAAFMPSVGWAIALLLLRMALSQMDVPARQSYVMSVVPPEERPAASSVTNVPRSLAAALTPLLAGAMLERTDFGWPLVCGGAVKAVYDLLLLAMFRAVPHREELA